MSLFGRRVAPTRLLCTLVVLMSTATSQAGDPEDNSNINVTCRYNEPDGWGRFRGSGEDVCILARTLMNGTCHSPIYTLDPNILPKDRWYTASAFADTESLNDGLACACERVMFNLLSACAGCQKWAWSNVTSTHTVWQEFGKYQDGSCSSNDQKRALPRPWDPEPPTWALNFIENRFNPTQVQSLIGPTSSPTSASPSTTSASPSIADPAAETSPAVASVAQPTNSSGPPIGAIVGGVIGGLILLGAIAGLAFWMHCRKRRTRDVAPSSEFLKPEYYATPPLLLAQDRRDSAYRDEIGEDTGPSPTRRQSWVGGLVTTRRQEEDDDDCEMLPPFTQGAYIGPSPHEKEFPERRHTGDTDITMRTNNTTAFLLSSSPTRRHGASDYFI